MNNDLINVRDLTFKNCQNLEEKFNQDFDEFQQQMGENFALKSEVQAKFNNIDNILRKHLNVGQETVLKKATLATRNQSPFSSNQLPQKRLCTCGKQEQS